MSRAVLCLLVVVAVCAVAEAGFRHFLKEERQKIDQDVSKVARKGAADAGFVVGSMYGVGEGTAKVIATALKKNVEKVKKHISKSINKDRTKIAS